MDKEIVLVTGASRGIGYEVYRQLAQHGMLVIPTSHHQEQGQAAATALVHLGLDVTYIPLDVTHEPSVRRAATAVEQSFGRVDVLINNAAAYVDWMETASNANLENAHQILETNLFGPWRVCQAFLPLLRKSPHARIVMVSSGAGSHGDAQFGLTNHQGHSASYGFSKAALNGLTSKLAAELAGTGILVNAVCPGLTATAPGMEAMGARPVQEGASSIVWAVKLPPDGPTGGFFRDGRPLPW